jgi:riboflavin biosynthesis pyrimidine reductase
MLQSTKLHLFNYSLKSSPMPRLPLDPLETLFDAKRGGAVPLSRRLGRLYGELRLSPSGPRPRVFSNFVSTLDGVVSLKIKGHEGGGDISGFSSQDRMVMGLLRASADAVIVGSGSLGADPRHMWTPEAICPELATDYRRLRKTLGKGKTALKVVVSASGRLETHSPVFATRGEPLLIVTTRAGAKRLARQKVPGCVEVRAAATAGAGGSDLLSANAILEEVCRTGPSRVLVEGGPRLLGSFYAAGLIDDQFLTLSPQLAGREVDDGRISLVMGQLFAPKTPLWATLADVRRGASMLFLHYAFEAVKRGTRRRPLG